MALVTASEVRLISGAPVDLISDADIDSIVALVESKTKDLFQIEFTPTKKIETLTGEYKEKILVDEYFPLTAYKVVNGETEMDLKNIYVHEEEGFFELFGDSIQGGFGFPYSTTRFSHYDLDVKIKYLYGAVQRDNTKTTDTSAVVSSGTSVSIEVADSSDFSVNDYVFIEDTNRAKEVFKITAIADSTHITAEILVNDYESGAMVTLAKTHDIFTQFVLYESALAVANNVIGSTYSIATSYTYPEYSATKGVPYVHFTNNFDRNMKQRDFFLSKIKSLLGTIV